jgi:hypothetical protein
MPQYAVKIQNKDLKKEQNLARDACQSRVSGELTGRRWVRLFPFSFALVRFCSEGSSDDKPSRRYALHFKSSYARNFVMRIFVTRGLYWIGHCLSSWVQKLSVFRCVANFYYSISVPIDPSFNTHIMINPLYSKSSFSVGGTYLEIGPFGKSAMDELNGDCSWAEYLHCCICCIKQTKLVVQIHMQQLDRL